ncbi:hypothetical protein SAMN05216266_12083 [Amycolatopsis marina]|uniref:Uncharacterized protein n=1 Tax=Amycolatopsis marina TaxID=490629 RepID=A0A1I1C7W6_9PSEU|nr:hypothetical protein [Amycolatopsis marina]SFB56968.1 hypothetical protein SAMN05216266_12083 [Amycolatopsis marina]
MSEIPIQAELRDDSATARSPEMSPPASGSKICAAGAGLLGAVCCGGGLIAVGATVIGATGAAVFMRSWVDMQGITLIASTLAILAVLALAAVVSRRARAGLAQDEARYLYGRTVLVLGAWALGGYFAFYIIAGSVLTLIGFEYPKM